MKSLLAELNMRYFNSANGCFYVYICRRKANNDLNVRKL